MTFHAIAHAVFAGAVLLLASPPFAKAEELGPAVGEIIPHSLEISDAAGEPQSFETLVGENGMALFFVRSVEWCPFCKAQAIGVNEARAEFEERGLSVVFVSYDPAEKQTAFVKQNDFAPPLLSDPRSEIIDAFGLRNEAHKEGRFAGIPHPAAFIVAPDRTIIAKLYEEDYASNDKSYRNRPAVDAVLAAADAALAD